MMPGKSKRVHRSGKRLRKTLNFKNFPTVAVLLFWAHTCFKSIRLEKTIYFAVLDSSCSSESRRRIGRRHLCSFRDCISAKHGTTGRAPLSWQKNSAFQYQIRSPFKLPITFELLFTEISQTPYLPTPYNE